MASSIPPLPIHRFPLPPSSLFNNVSAKDNGVISDPITHPSKHETPPQSNKPKLKIVIKHPKQPHPSTMIEGNGSEPTISKESSSLHVIESKPTKPDDDQKNIGPQFWEKIAATKKKKEKKRRLLSKEEIEEDIAAIEALAGSKRLRRPKKQSMNIVLRRKLGLLFPGLG